MGGLDDLAQLRWDRRTPRLMMARRTTTGAPSPHPRCEFFSRSATPLSNSLKLTWWAQPQLRNAQKANFVSIANAGAACPYYMVYRVGLRPSARLERCE